MQRVILPTYTIKRHYGISLTAGMTDSAFFGQQNIFDASQSQAKSSPLSFSSSLLFFFFLFVSFSGLGVPFRAFECIEVVAHFEDTLKFYLNCSYLLILFEISCLCCSKGMFRRRSELHWIHAGYGTISDAFGIHLLFYLSKYLFIYSFIYSSIYVPVHIYVEVIIHLFLLYFFCS